MGCCTSSQSEPPLLKKSNFILQRQGTLQNFFEILETLGVGSYGTVSKIRDRKTGLIQAMKEVVKIQVPEDQMKLFMNEIETLKGLDHPNIMKIYQVIESKKSYYIVCEYLAGGELFQMLKNKKRFTEENAKKYVYDILTGLNYLHSNQIVHCDLKLENLVMSSDTSDGGVKIIDFGISRRLDQGPISGKIGSTYYMAPEIYTGDYDEKIDMWSLGVMVYLMLSGGYPYKMEAEEVFLKRVKTQNLDFSKGIWGKISDQCVDFIRKLLNPNPQKRLSAARAIKHPWLKSEVDSSTMSIQTSFCDNIKNFKKSSKVITSILVYISSQMLTQQEESKLGNMFKALDVDGNGKLSKEELIQASQSFKLFTEKEVDDIFENCDIDRSGFIDYSEFLVATMGWNQLFSQEKANMLFKYFEKCGNLSLDDFRACFNNITQDEWNEFLREVDGNKDGNISIEEFKLYLVNAVKI